MTDESKVLVRMAHVRTVGMCSRGVREWFVQRGLDHGKFLREGIAVSELRLLNDVLVNQVCDYAVKEYEEQERVVSDLRAKGLL